MAVSEHTSDSFVFKTDRPWPNARLKVGAIVGHATESGARIWLRTGRPGEFSLLLYRWDAALKAAGGEAALRFALGAVPLTLDEAGAVLPGMHREDFKVTGYTTDTTHVVDLEGLDPDTRYGYAIHARDEERVLLGHNRLRRFRTPPSENERRAFQFALFSCHMPYAVHGLFGKRTETTNLDMWEFLGATLKRHGADVDLVIAGGDQCYSDGVATLDYAFTRGGCAFYVLDGRGQRDIERESYRILGREQFDRFEAWAGALTPEVTPFAFVVSAVPVLHTRAALVQADDPLDRLGLGDDLRDSWEHELHDTERGALMTALFGAAAKGVRVSVLSGDVHVSAVFAIEDGEDNRIYQLTSSAITYNLSLPQSWILRAGAADDGETPEGHRFERLALYTDSGYALVSVDPDTGEAWFKLYGEQKLDAPPDSREGAVALSHSLAKIRLF